MSNPIHPRLELPLLVAEGLLFLTQELARLAAKHATPHPRRRGATVRPGSMTPLWNALSSTTRSQLKTYGEKSRLGRILGVPPQRVHEYLMAKSAMPDAERTLQLLVWLSQHRTGGEPG